MDESIFPSESLAKLYTNAGDFFFFFFFPLFLSVLAFVLLLISHHCFQSSKGFPVVS
jgi:hypothetical protein